MLGGCIGLWLAYLVLAGYLHLDRVTGGDRKPTLPLIPVLTAFRGILSNRNGSANHCRSGWAGFSNL
jgi:hypothetical protein